jgi:hypothetical protein
MKTRVNCLTVGIYIYYVPTVIKNEKFTTRNDEKLVCGMSREGEGGTNESIL